MQLLFIVSKQFMVLSIMLLFGPKGDLQDIPQDIPESRQVSTIKVKNENRPIYYDSMQYLLNNDPLFKDSVKSLFYNYYRSEINANIEEQRYYERKYNELELNEKKYEDYNLYKIKYIEKTFNWQYLSSIIIFCTVMLITLIGIFFSWKHFNRAKNTNQTPSSDANNMVDQDIFDASFSIQEGIKLKTSILGIVILVVSLAFLYFYLNFVYPIKLVENNETNKPKDSNSWNYDSTLFKNLQQ